MIPHAVFSLDGIPKKIIEAFRRQAGFESYSSASRLALGRIEDRALRIFVKLSCAFSIDLSDAYIPDSPSGFFSNGYFHPSLPGIGVEKEAVYFSAVDPGNPASVKCRKLLDSLCRDFDALAAVLRRSEDEFSAAPSAAEAFELMEHLHCASPAAFKFVDSFAEGIEVEMPQRLAAGALFCLSFALARSPWRVVEVFGFNLAEELGIRGIKAASDYPSRLRLDELARVHCSRALDSSLFIEDSSGLAGRMEHFLRAAAALDLESPLDAHRTAQALEDARNLACRTKEFSEASPLVRLVMSRGFILPAAVRTSSGDELVWIPDLRFEAAAREFSKFLKDRSESAAEDLFIESVFRASRLLSLEKVLEVDLLRAARLASLAMQTKISVFADEDCCIHLSAFFDGRKEEASDAFLELQARLFASSFLPQPACSAFAGRGEAVLNPEDSAGLLSSLDSLSCAGFSPTLDQRLEAAGLPKAAASIRMNSKYAPSKSLFSKNALSDFEWTISAGGCDFTVEDFEKAARNLSDSGTIRPRLASLNGALFIFDPLISEKLLLEVKRNPRPSQSEKICALISGESSCIEQARIRPDAELSASAEKLLNAPAAETSSSFSGRLLEHQKLGFSRLLHGFKNGIGQLLADDMGLGKTVQTAAALARLKDDGELDHAPALIVAPASLLSNWRRELAKFAPGLSCAVLHGADRSIDEALQADVLLTSFATAAKDAGRLRRICFRALVVDEAHNLKNPDALYSKTIKSFKFKSAAALTGTPIENRLMDLWAVFSIIEPALFGTKKEFIQRFAEPIESRRDKAALARLKKILEPFMLRRLKTDAALSSMLPEKTIISKTAPLFTEQAALYRKALAKANSSAGSIGVLELISELKQICNSAGQIEGRFARTPDSGKGELLLEILAECRACGFKALVFSQYVETLKRLAAWTSAKFADEPILLHGAMSLAERESAAEEFRSRRAPLAMFASLKAAGSGLNLESADVVVHYDMWWNPAVEEQASDRACRIGRRSNVVVYRLMTEGTLEEKINKLLEEKKELADAALSSGESWLAGLTDEEKAELFSLGLHEDYSE